MEGYEIFLFSTVRRHISRIKKRYTSNIKERVEEPMSVIYDMFKVPRPIQQNRTSKRKRTPIGTMDINPKIKNMMSYGHNKKQILFFWWGRGRLL